MTWLLSSTVVITGTWKNGKMVMIAYHMFENSIGAYIEWLVNALMMTANKTECKDAPLVILPVVAITHKPDSLVYPWSFFFSSNM
jgi:hypothetical protein